MTMNTKFSTTYEKLNINACRIMLIVAILAFIIFEMLFGIGAESNGHFVLITERIIVSGLVLILLISFHNEGKYYTDNLLGVASIACILWLEYYAYTTRFEPNIAFFTLLAIVVSMTFHQKLWIVTSLFVVGGLANILMVVVTLDPIIDARMYLFVVITFLVLNYIAAYRNLRYRKDAYVAMYIDALTQIPNKKAAKEAYLEKSTQVHDETTMGILLLDINNFKNINTNYGQEYGDLVLKKIARVASCSMRDEDFIFRSGSDEFIVIIDNIKGLEEVKTVAKRIIEELENAFKPEVGISFVGGVSLSEQASSSFDDVMERALFALRKAKDHSMNKIVAN